MIVLMMGAGSTSETSANIIRLHGVITKKTATFIYAAVKT
jgi:hypothetical protein